MDPDLSTISPDGKRLFFVGNLEEDGGRQSYFLDLTTEEVRLAKMPDQQQLKYGEKLLPYIVHGVWDPLEPAYLYAEIPERIIMNDYGNDIEYNVFRIHAETLVGTPILPPSTDDLCDITPDGRYLLFDSWDGEEGINHPSRYSLETHTWTPLPDEDMWYASMRTYAPNGELLAGFTNTENADVLVIRDLPTDRQALVFNAKQALFSVPQGMRPALICTPRWLPDSAGLFVNILPMGRDVTYTTWQVGINGEAAAIASDVCVITNSQNGRYWLLKQGRFWGEQQLYIITVDDAAPVGE